ncbi:CBS domain-containing protein [Streptomyces marincola]|uniref:CBS domain-containing protein n=1 Tax=Streptomyces marincola TaxID=2878388 RepID=UPI001CF453DD|nr:CBS domain-containing protein [Streptomyces marincola]UCM91226.1 CBS domain-containing protein [Streptomyces marincola]
MARTVAELMTREPATVRGGDTVADAARLMKEHDSGNVAVVEDGGRVVGIVTDRDLAVRVLAEGRAADTPVQEVSSREELATVAPSATLAEAAEAMRGKAVRRLPVVDDGKLLGVLSLGDLAIELDPESGLADVSAARPSE